MGLITALARLDRVVMKPGGIAVKPISFVPRSRNRQRRHWIQALIGRLAWLCDAWSGSLKTGSPRSN
jgi:hypothetical protein